MIKRYNQFVKENVSEDFEDTMASAESEIDTVVAEPTQIFGEEPSTEIPVEEEEVEVNPYEKALEDLAYEAGVNYEPGSQRVIVGDREVTFPSEKYDVEKRTGFYQIRGIKGDFSTPQQVLDAIRSKPKGNRTVQTPDSDEPSFEETESDLESEMGKFESKSYKTTRFKK